MLGSSGPINVTVAHCVTAQVLPATRGANIALFGNFQQITAQQIAVFLMVLVAANTPSGVMAKMLSPQSIAVATGAVTNCWT